MRLHILVYNQFTFKEGETDHFVYQDKIDDAVREQNCMLPFANIALLNKICFFVFIVSNHARLETH